MDRMKLKVDNSRPPLFYHDQQLMRPTHTPLMSHHHASPPEGQYGKYHNTKYHVLLKGGDKGFSTRETNSGGFSQVKKKSGFLTHETLSRGFHIIFQKIISRYYEIIRIH